MDIQSVKLSDIVDFRPRELSNEEWSRIESREGVMELRRPLEEARLPGGTTPRWIIREGGNRRCRSALHFGCPLASSCRYQRTHFFQLLISRIEDGTEFDLRRM